jgi:hypothetical protein
MIPRERPIALIRRALLITVGIGLTVGLAACQGSPSLTAQPTTTIGPAPTPPTTATSFSVQKCLNQVIDGRTVRDIMIPDLVTLDLQRPASFPNGRRMQDPVIDIELAYLFLDLTKHSPTTLVNIPLNPLGLDQPLRTSFPFYAPPFAPAKLSETTGTDFNFRTNPESDYVRVERVGVPAVSTINVLGPRKNAYNDGSPTADIARTYEADITAGLTVLANILVDDLQGLSLTPCATPL